MVDRLQSDTLEAAGARRTVLPLTALSNQLFRSASRSAPMEGPSHAIYSDLSPATTTVEAVNERITADEPSLPGQPFTVGFVGLGAMGSGMVNGKLSLAGHHSRTNFICQCCRMQVYP